MGPNADAKDRGNKWAQMDERVTSPSVENAKKKNK